MSFKEYKTIPIVWRGIKITIRHCTAYNCVYSEIHGSNMTHTEIKRDDSKQLPMTSTGYTSRYLDERSFEEYKDITDYVLQWLEFEAKSKKWIAYEADQLQLKLF